MIRQNGDGELIITRGMLTALAIMLTLLGMAIGGLTGSFTSGKRAGEYATRIAVNERSITEIKLTLHENSKRLQDIQQRVARIEGLLRQR